MSAYQEDNFSETESLFGGNDKGDKRDRNQALDEIILNLNNNIRKYPINGVYGIENYLIEGDLIKLRYPEKIELIDNIIMECKDFSSFQNEKKIICDSSSNKELIESTIKNSTFLSLDDKKECQKFISTIYSLLTIRIGEIEEIYKRVEISRVNILSKFLLSLDNPLPDESKNSNFWQQIYNICLHDIDNFEVLYESKKSIDSLVDIPNDITFEQINHYFNLNLKKTYVIFNTQDLSNYSIKFENYFLKYLLSPKELVDVIMDNYYPSDNIFIGLTTNLHILNSLSLPVYNLFLMHIILNNKRDDFTIYNNFGLKLPKHIETSSEYKSISTLDQVLEIFSFIYSEKINYLNILDNPIIKNYLLSNIDDLKLNKQNKDEKDLKTMEEKKIFENQDYHQYLEASIEGKKNLKDKHDLLTLQIQNILDQIICKTHPSPTEFKVINTLRLQLIKLDDLYEIFLSKILKDELKNYENHQKSLELLSNLESFQEAGYFSSSYYIYFSFYDKSCYYGIEAILRESKRTLGLQ